MTAVLALVERILGLILSLFGVVSLVQQNTAHSAQELVPYHIDGNVGTVTAAVTSPTIGLAHIESRLAAIVALLGDGVPGVLDAIAALPAGSDLVNPDNSLIAAAVWGKYLDNPLDEPTTADYALTLASSYARNFINVGAFRQLGDPNFLVEYQESLGYHWSSYFVTPQPNYADVLPAESTVDWLNRTDLSGRTWELDADTGTAISYDLLNGEYQYLVRCILRTPPRPATAGAAAAPVWPGEPNVVEGTPVALGADVTIPGPLDGVRIALTTPPSGLSNFSMGGQTWYYRAGQIAFVSDVGDVETWQYITWTNALYCPRQMYRAASAILRGLAGVEGTATPWLTA